MALNLPNALFRSLNSIKSGNEVCRRESPVLLAHLRLRIVRIYHFLFPPSTRRSAPLIAVFPLLTIARTSRNCRARFNSRFVPGIIEFSARFFAFCAGTERLFSLSEGSVPRFRSGGPEWTAIPTPRGILVAAKIWDPRARARERKRERQISDKNHNAFSFILF